MLFMCQKAHGYDLLPKDTTSNIVNAIKLIENSKTYPYGIRSIRLKGKNQLEKEIYARQICVNTVNNNYLRWQKAGKRGEFLNFLADVYCPASADATGNSNWKKNIHKMVQ